MRGRRLLDKGSRRSGRGGKDGGRAARGEGEVDQRGGGSGGGFDVSVEVAGEDGAVEEDLCDGIELSLSRSEVSEDAASLLILCRGEVGRNPLVALEKHKRTSVKLGRWTRKRKRRKGRKRRTSSSSSSLQHIASTSSLSKSDSSSLSSSSNSVTGSRGEASASSSSSEFCRRTSSMFKSALDKAVLGRVLTSSRRAVGERARERVS